MTPDATDMSTPVTRGELKQEFAHFEQRLDVKFKQWLETWGGALLARMESSEQRLIERIESTEQRLSERIESGEQRLSERMNLDIESSEQRLIERIESSEQRLIERMNLGLESTEQRLSERIESSEQRLHADLAQHTNAAAESMTAQIAVIDEHYADLPARVHQLESNVFPLKRR
jgi:exonuclease VII large subunit